MYALWLDGKNIKKTKSVKSKVVAGTITFDDYTQWLRDKIEMTWQHHCIRSKLHHVYTVSETKIPLSLYDDKTIYRARFRDAVVGILANTFIKFCVLRTSYFTHILYFLHFALHVFYIVHVIFSFTFCVPR